MITIHLISQDIGWPDCFNSGVFCAKPKKTTYNNLLKVANEHASFDGGDQGLLNSFFKSWSGHCTDSDLVPTARLPFTFNTTPSAFYSYIPAYIEFQKDVKVIHFIGKVKPWHFDRNEDGSIAKYELI